MLAADARGGGRRDRLREAGPREGPPEIRSGAAVRRTAAAPRGGGRQAAPEATGKFWPGIGL